MRRSSSAAPRRASSPRFIRIAAAGAALVALAACATDGPAGIGGQTPMDVQFDSLPSTEAVPVIPVATPTVIMLTEGPEPVADVAKTLIDTYAPDAGARKTPIQPLAASRGFVASLTPDELAGVQSDERVEYAEGSRPVYADWRPAFEPAGRGVFGQRTALLGGGTAAMATTPWALDRITQRALPLDNAASFNGTGAGVTIYIIDTGVRESHAEFGNRVVDGPDYILGGTASGDCGGHGTKVASDAAGATMGTARQAKIVNVRVLGCDGSGSSVGVVQGIDWVIADVQAHPGPAVINMSLGISGVCVPVNQATARAVAAGITVVVAAGNSNVNACGASPAGEPTAVTVGATDIADNRASFSNWGSCVDIWSPGVSVRGADHSGDNAYGDWSGTSAASPFTAGVVALYLQQYPTASPAQVSAALIAGATTGAVKGTNVTNNRLVYLPADGSAPNSGTPTTPPGGFVSPPAAKSAITCTRRSCTFDGRTSTDAEAVAKWAWTYGDNAKGTGATATHKFKLDGTYYTKLTVTNARGLTDTRTDSVKIVDTPPTAAGVAVCTGWACRFDATRSSDDGSVTRYSWSYGDGAAGASAGPALSHTFKAAGTYSATLTVTDDAGQRSSVTVVATTTPRPPKAAARITCSGRTCTFDASAATDDIGIATYTWDFLDGTMKTGKVVTQTYTTAGLKKFKITVQNTSGLSTTLQGQFTVR